MPQIKGPNTEKRILILCFSRKNVILNFFIGRIFNANY